mgnify:CR=1 FL=1
MPLYVPFQSNAFSAVCAVSATVASDTASVVAGVCSGFVAQIDER